MAMTDILTAVRTLLRASSDVDTLTYGRIYRTRLPADQASSMPRSSVVLSRAGGRPDRGYSSRGRNRIDVRCYGTNDDQSYRVFAAVHTVLKGWHPNTVGNCLVHSFEVETGPIDLSEPDVNWPLVFSSYLCSYSEVPVAA